MPYLGSYSRLATYNYNSVSIGPAPDECNFLLLHGPELPVKLLFASDGLGICPNFYSPRLVIAYVDSRDLWL